MSSQNLISRNGGWTPFQQSTARTKQNQQQQQQKQTNKQNNFNFALSRGRGIPSQPAVLGIPRVSLSPRYP